MRKVTSVDPMFKTRLAAFHPSEPITFVANVRIFATGLSDFPIRIARLYFVLSAKFPDEVSEAWRDIADIFPAVICVLTKYLLSDIGEIQHVSEAFRAKIDQQSGGVVACERKQFTRYTRLNAFESRMRVTLSPDSTDGQFRPRHQGDVPHDNRLFFETTREEIRADVDRAADGIIL